MSARRQASLFLHEELMLLSLCDEKGTVATGAWYAQAIGGAILAELLLASRIAVEEGKKTLVSLVSDKPMGEPVIDECLESIAKAKRRARAGAWVQRFSNLKHLKHRVARGLCERRILRAGEDTVLLLFRRKIYPEIDPKPERELIERLRKAIFGEGHKVDSRTAVLVSLANAADLLKIPFGKKSLKMRKKRIEQLVNGELVGQATKQAVHAAQAAIIACCIMPATLGAAT